LALLPFLCLIAGSVGVAKLGLRVGYPKASWLLMCGVAALGPMIHCVGLIGSVLGVGGPGPIAFMSSYFLSPVLLAGLTLWVAFRPWTCEGGGREAAM